MLLVISLSHSKHITSTTPRIAKKACQSATHSGTNTKTRFKSSKMLKTDSLDWRSRQLSRKKPSKMPWFSMNKGLWPLIKCRRSAKKVSLLNIKQKLLHRIIKSHRRWSMTRSRYCTLNTAHSCKSFSNWRSLALISWSTIWRRWWSILQVLEPKSRVNLRLCKSRLNLSVPRQISSYLSMKIDLLMRCHRK